MQPVSKPIKVYGSLFCSMVAPVRAVLDRANIPYEYVDILRNRQAARLVQEINNGYTSVPTLVFSDGSTLTEPTTQELIARLHALGFEVPEPTIFDHLRVVFHNPMTYLLGAVMVLIGITGNNVPLAAVGSGILAFGIWLNLRRKRT